MPSATWFHAGTKVSQGKYFLRVYLSAHYRIGWPNKNVFVTSGRKSSTFQKPPSIVAALYCFTQGSNGNRNMTVYEQCYATYSDNLHQVVQCVAEWAETKQNATFANTQSIQLADADEFRRWLLILCGALVFFMQTGFAMICAGCVRKKNMANT